MSQINIEREFRKTEAEPLLPHLIMPAHHDVRPGDVRVTEVGPLPAGGDIRDVLVLGQRHGRARL